MASSSSVVETPHSKLLIVWTSSTIGTTLFPYCKVHKLVQSQYQFGFKIVVTGSGSPKGAPKTHHSAGHNENITPGFGEVPESLCCSTSGGSPEQSCEEQIQ